MGSRTDACPKRMVHGPCGGVRHDGSCELGGFPCSFVDLDGPVRWAGPPRGATSAAPWAGAPDGRPIVVTDLTVAPYDRTSIARVGARLAGSCDLVLVGEHQGRPDFPPTLLLPLLLDAGVRPLVTLTCRDRNRLVLEQELAGLAALEAPGVFCATGDARPPDIRPEVRQVFDLDGTQLTALAAAAGLPVAVPESPGAAPVGVRPARLREKQAAGAGAAILNRTDTPEATAAFVAAARAAGVTMPLLGAVSVFTDERSARVLQAFPGLELPDDLVARVLGAADPVTAGVEAAVEQARALLDIPGVAGVNLSGLATDRGEEAGAEIKAAVGRAIQDLRR
jgi:5,10-methylenetetrahydrofolate reductase